MSRASAGGAVGSTVRSSRAAVATAQLRTSVPIVFRRPLPPSDRTGSRRAFAAEAAARAATAVAAAAPAAFGKDVGGDSGAPAAAAVRAGVGVGADDWATANAETGAALTEAAAGFGVKAGMGGCNVGVPFVPLDGANPEDPVAAAPLALH